MPAKSRPGNAAGPAREASTRAWGEKPVTKSIDSEAKSADSEAKSADSEAKSADSKAKSADSEAKSADSVTEKAHSVAEATDLGPGTTRSTVETACFALIPTDFVSKSVDFVVGMPSRAAEGACFVAEPA